MIAQRELEVWRGPGWRDTAIALTFLGLVFLALPGVLLILAEDGRHAVLGVGFLGAGLVVAWLRRPFSRWGRERLTLRLDPATTTLWTERSKRRGDPIRIDDAECIQDFALERQTAVVGRQRSWALRALAPDPLVVSDHLRFASRRHAKRARKALRELLQLP